MYFRSKYSFSRNKRIAAILFEVIKANNLFKIEDLGYYQKIYTSLTFTFYFTRYKLVIDTDSHGASYTKQVNELGPILELALGLRLLEINISNPKFTRYEFLLIPIQSLIIDNSHDIPKSKNTIQLDSEKYWDYIKSPHALIAGATSSGKTYMLYYLMLQFAQQDAEIYILDPKRSDLSSLIHFIPEGHNHVAITPNQICGILRTVNDEMNLRYEKYFSQPTKMGENFQYYNLQPIVIFFDEVAAFNEEDKKVAKEADSYLKQLLFKGRQAGIFLILSTQKPTAEAIPTAIRDQMGLRIALGQLSKPGYKMTLGDDWDELPSVETGTGKGLIMMDGMNWNVPRAYTSPLLNLESIRFQDTLSKLLEEGKQKFQ